MRRLFPLLCALGFLGCGTNTVGRPCGVTDDCDRGQTCFDVQPGGYCSKGCSEEGSVRECPGGSLCARNGGQLLCSAICQLQRDCRPEYECNGVANTSQKVCALK